MLAEGLSPNTIRLRLCTLTLAARSAGKPADQLDADDLRTWLAGHSNPNTRATYFGVVSAFFDWMVREGRLQKNPTAVIRRPRVPRGAPRPVSTPALHAILDSCTPRARIMLLLAAYQGLRAGEVANVRGDDVDLDAGTLRVRGKGGVEAVLPLHPDIALLAASMPARGWWFPSPKNRGLPVRSSAVTGAVRHACGLAGLRTHGAHPLRHWYGTWLVRSGADLRTAQTLLRHASLATTAIYVEVTEDSRRSAVLRLPDITGRGAA